MKKLLLLICVALLACSAESMNEGTQDADTDADTDAAEFAAVQQPVIASCLKRSGDPQHGVSSSSFTRCNPGVSTSCTLPNTKVPFEIALTGTWGPNDRLEWAVGGKNVADFFYMKFTAWHVLTDPLSDKFRFNSNTFNTQITGIATSQELAILKDYVGIAKVTRPAPSWWANRATKTSAPFSDFVTMACIQGHPLTGGGTTTTWTQCDRWTAGVDYDKLRQWAVARGVSVQPLIESVVKKLVVWSMGLGAGSGSGGKITDPVLYSSGSLSNPTGFVQTSSGGEEVSWVNDYEVSGEFANHPTFTPLIQQCLANCGWNFSCQQACHRVLYCRL